MDDASAMTESGIPYARDELSARTGFGTNLTDRAAELRDLDAPRAVLRMAQGARFAVVAGERPVLRRGPDGLTVWHEAGELGLLGAIEHEVFLGREQGTGRFGVRIAAELADVLKEREDLLLLDLRAVAVQGLLPAWYLPLRLRLSMVAIICLLAPGLKAAATGAA